MRENICNWKKSKTIYGIRKRTWDTAVNILLFKKKVYLNLSYCLTFFLTGGFVTRSFPLAISEEKK